ncbi:hypothetical protein VKT23_011787 [Stygiomarasmius scandens]|uniref:Uncharacterized protein n=1 Tax=Marasmiellus scandens TaxID=2682957 RepID=A0ABR1J8Z4_9AGAR
MPGPAVYVVTAVIGVVAAGLAFKEFVYDPHIKPHFEARRRARSRRGQPVPVPVSVVFSAHRRSSTDSSSSSSNNDNHEDKRKMQDLKNMKDMEDLKMDSLFEMEALAWRDSTASASGVETDMGTLRPRNRNRAGLDEAFPPMVPTSSGSTPTSNSPFVTLSPSPAPALSRTSSTGQTTHVIASSSGSPTPSTTVASSRLNSPLPPLPKEVDAEEEPSSSSSQAPSLREQASVTTLRSPPTQHPAPLPAVPTNEDPFSSPSLVPSLSFSHELDGELVSPPSSRAISPPVSLDSLRSGSAFAIHSEGEGEDDSVVGIGSRPMSPFSDFSQVSSVSGNDQEDEDERQTRTQFGFTSLGGSFVSDSYPDNNTGTGNGNGLGLGVLSSLSFAPPPSLGASFMSEGDFDRDIEDVSQSYYYTPSNSVFLPTPITSRASGSPGGIPMNGIEEEEVISLPSSPRSPRSPLSDGSDSDSGSGSGSSLEDSDSDSDSEVIVHHDADDVVSEFGGSEVSEESWASVSGGTATSRAGNGYGARRV